MDSNKKVWNFEEGDILVYSVPSGGRPDDPNEDGGGGGTPELGDPDTPIRNLDPGTPSAKDDFGSHGAH